jgi:CubicO group peptidase (beta-lactamase class C family)
MLIDKYTYSLASEIWRVLLLPTHPVTCRASLYGLLALLIVWPGEARTESRVRTKKELAGAIAQVENLFVSEYKKEHSAGLTAGIVSGPELVWAKSYGLADIEIGRPSTRDSVYRIGSIYETIHRSDAFAIG